MHLKVKKNKVASVIDSLGEGILSVRNVYKRFGKSNRI